MFKFGNGGRFVKEIDFEVLVILIEVVVLVLCFFEDVVIEVFVFWCVVSRLGFRVWITGSRSGVFGSVIFGCLVFRFVFMVFLEMLLIV